MDVIDAIKQRRTVRRFTAGKVAFPVLEQCVEAARLCPTARNAQPLEFIVVDAEEKCKEVLSAINLGGIVKEKGMKRGEEPKAYIVIAAKKELESKYTAFDVGIAAEAIVLAALQQGIASCIIGSVDRSKLAELLKVPETHEIMLAVALGHAAEKPVAEAMKGNSTSYWIEGEQLHVPKRSLQEIMHRNSF